MHPKRIRRRPCAVPSGQRPAFAHACQAVKVRRAGVARKSQQGFAMESAEMTSHSKLHIRNLTAKVTINPFLLRHYTCYYSHIYRSSLIYTTRRPHDDCYILLHCRSWRRRRHWPRCIPLRHPTRAQAQDGAHSTQDHGREQAFLRR